jgi:demethylmenaquinone methyltransferase / 2-methoxy-6-polyprenyl-1,4-benzoquinol methylase
MEKVNFGFKKVDQSEKKDLVGRVFSSVADKYDLMNDVMSLGIHRLWKKTLVEQLTPDKKLLDVASGTGDIAKLYYLKSKNPDITLCDINLEMLNRGRDKLIDLNITKGLKFVCCDAQELPFVDFSFDYYTIAFGIRNVTKMNEVLSEAFRVLKPGGKFLCLEFSNVKMPILNSLYDFYSFNIIPKIGGLITGDSDSYQYFVESIRTFPTQEKFLSMMQEAGFIITKYKNLSCGIVTLYSGYRV